MRHHPARDLSRTYRCVSILIGRAALRADQHVHLLFPQVMRVPATGLACQPTIAYSTVDTGRTPSAVPSSSNFPPSLGSEPGLIAQSYRAFSSPPLWPTYTIARPALSLPVKADHRPANIRVRKV